MREKFLALNVILQSVVHKHLVEQWCRLGFPAPIDSRAKGLCRNFKKVIIQSSVAFEELNSNKEVIVPIFKIPSIHLFALLRRQQRRALEVEETPNSNTQSRVERICVSELANVAFHRNMICATNPRVGSKQIHK
ncbi:hypothetical protein O6H91_15G086600 [Diphasiastrum complanatum]|uniref:Uncharacterized protein n=1 Tax=Diphasiastrum complanatum TaxID=34168 RepID=A0ACC2BKG3_DIPCM|nr:hypothetical protein O6H91_15G086600 [Diphasiastrum complanatum]